MAIATGADILIHKPNGLLVAAVEVKNRLNLTVPTAVTLRRNLLRHGVLPDEVRFFLLLSQDIGHLWDEHSPHDSSGSPVRTFSMQDALRPYLPQGIDGRVGGAPLETAVLFWLTDLSLACRSPSNEAERELAAAGFIDTICGAVISRGAA